jgi:hypothetical protein
VVKTPATAGQAKKANIKAAAALPDCPGNGCSLSRRSLIVEVNNKTINHHKERSQKVSGKIYGIQQKIDHYKFNTINFKN